MADTDSTNHTLRATEDALDVVDTKLLQLHAMLMMTFGEAQSSFDNMGDELRGNFMWACSDIADDCRRLVLESFSRLRVEASNV